MVKWPTKCSSEVQQPHRPEPTVLDPRRPADLRLRPPAIFLPLDGKEKVQPARPIDPRRGDRRSLDPLLRRYCTGVQENCCPAPPGRERLLRPGLVLARWYRHWVSGCFRVPGRWSRVHHYPRQMIGRGVTLARISARSAEGGMA